MVAISVGALGQWLSESRVDSSAWTKTLKDLFGELERGEISLEKDEKGFVLRKLRVAKLIIRDPGHPERGCLIEIRQTLPNGRARERNRSPSEKMFGGEWPEEAVRRGIMEELGLSPDQFRIGNVSSPIEEEELSPSYRGPGLRSIYYIFRAEIVLSTGCPALDETYEFVEADGTRHLYGWENPKAI